MNNAEVARYLGMHAHDIDERTAGLISSCYDKLYEAARPKHVYAVFSIDVKDDAVSFPDIIITSASLAKHLNSCDSAALFAATLGAEADRLIASASYRDISEAAVLGACAAVMIEEYCDKAMNEIADESAARFLRPRFSPGYGDFPVSYQHDILSILSAPKRIGLCVTDEDMLAPTKSITAVIGITDERGSCNINKCASCDNTFCVFRRSGS